MKCGVVVNRSICEGVVLGVLIVMLLNDIKWVYVILKGLRWMNDGII